MTRAFINLTIILLLSTPGLTTWANYDDDDALVYTRRYTNSINFTIEKSMWDHIEQMPSCRLDLPSALVLNHADRESIFSHVGSIKIDYNVKHLAIYYNHFKIKDSEFINFGNLQSLRIHESKLANEHFEGFKLQSNHSLTQLRMSKNNIISLGNVCYKHHLLQTIHITNNYIREINENTFTSCTFLKDLNLSNNMINIIEPYSFTNRYMISLDLHGNNLTTILKDSFSAMSSISNLNLANSSVTFLESGAFSAKEIKILNLGFNHITELVSNTSSQRIPIHELDLSNNRLEKIDPNYFIAFHGIVALNLENNDLRGIASNSFDGLIALKYLEMANCSLSFMELGALNGLINLQKLNLTKNKLTCLHCGIVNSSMHNFHHLNLSYNAIESIDVCAFKHFQKLETLDLSHNNISKILLGTFSPLNGLQKLIISNNILTQINVPIIFPLTSLMTLDVSSNQFVNWDVYPIISHIKTINHVDISDNYWNCEYLTKLLKTFSDKQIDVNPRSRRIFHKQNVNGISCTDENFEHKLTKNETSSKKNIFINEPRDNLGNISERSDNMKFYNNLNIEERKIERNMTNKILLAILNKLEKPEENYEIEVIAMLTLISTCLLILCGLKVIDCYFKKRSKNLMSRYSIDRTISEELSSCQS